MSTDICELCGHPELSHESHRCVWCEADYDVDHKVELCPGFKPDVFNMWKDEDDESNRGPQPA
jgi:hypothetical protein